MEHLKISLVEGTQAPKYPGFKDELKCLNATITERGTHAGLPIVDFHLEAPNGDKFLFVLTGRLVNVLSAAIKGANLRNHGVSEP